jgi:hypothetical protein
MTFGGAYITKTLSARTSGSLGRRTEDPGLGRRRCLPPRPRQIAEGTILVSLDAAKTPVNMPWLALAGFLILLGTFDGKRGVRFEPLTSCLNLSRRAAQVRL